MSFKVAIKNIGKLADAELRIGKFTVFAGPNNTGKSFVSKLLYSLYHAMREDYAENHIYNLTQSLSKTLNYLIQTIRDENLPLHSLAEKIRVLEQRIEALENVVRSGRGDIEELDKIIPELFDRVENIQKTFPDMRSSLKREISHFSYSLVETLETLEQSLDELQKSIHDKNAEGFIAFITKNIIKRNLIQNFQVENLSDLMSKKGEPANVDVEGLGKFQFSTGETSFDMEFADKNPELRYLLYSRVIYLESPTYWKLKNALENLRLDPKHLSNRREQLSGIPGYFYDLASIIKIKFSEDIAFPDLYKKLTSKNVLGGKIVISETGDLSFQENGRNFSLPVTAMGIANLGILALLIERKILDKGSFLFIDEPEAHLHPAWQVIMAETLFELSRKGVNVVIATHSADILKWLEVHVKKNPDDEQLVALNQFPVNGREVEEDFETRIAEIKRELTEPFSDLYLQGL